MEDEVDKQYNPADDEVETQAVQLGDKLKEMESRRRTTERQGSSGFFGLFSRQVDKIDDLRDFHNSIPGQQHLRS